MSHTPGYAATPFDPKDLMVMESLPFDEKFFIADEDYEKIMELVRELDKEDRLKFNHLKFNEAVQLASNSHISSMIMQGCECKKLGYRGHRLTYQDFGFEEGWDRKWKKL